MTDSIRVLQIATTMERAGLETMLMNYYRNIDRSKVQFDFLLHRDGEQAYSEEIRSLGGNIYSVPPFNPLNTNGYLSALDQFFREHSEYRVVHSHLDCLSAVPLSYAKKYGIQNRLAHTHACKMTWDAKFPIRMFYKAQIPYYATKLLACSEEAGKWMFGKHSFSVVPNAIDCETFQYNESRRIALRRKYGLDNKLVIGHVGRFDPVKNHVFLLDVFREIVQQFSESVLVLAGIGNTMPDIKQKVDEYGLSDRVIFLGSVADVASLLSAMDVFVFPSTYEGLGISLIEAQTSGLPCLTSKGRVPDSANVSGFVKYIPLEAGAKVWADEAVKAATIHRNSIDAVNLVSDAGYNIHIAAKKLEDMYLELYNNQV